jgi:hypothetical protein
MLNGDDYECIDDDIESDNQLKQCTKAFCSLPTNIKYTLFMLNICIFALLGWITYGVLSLDNYQFIIGWFTFVTLISICITYCSFHPTNIEILSVYFK